MNDNGQHPTAIDWATMPDWISITDCSNRRVIILITCDAS